MIINRAYHCSVHSNRLISVECIKKRLRGLIKWNQTSDSIVTTSFTDTIATTQIIINEKNTTQSTTISLFAIRKQRHIYIFTYMNSYGRKLCIRAVRLFIRCRFALNVCRFYGYSSGYSCHTFRTGSAHTYILWYVFILFLLRVRRRCVRSCNTLKFIIKSVAII